MDRSHDRGQHRVDTLWWKGAGSREKGEGTREETCSLIGANVSQRALTQKRTLWGGALEVGDLCLLEDSSERRGALVSDVIFPETVRDGVWAV